MPYADPEKQRKAVLKAVKKHRIKKRINRAWKSFPNQYITPLAIWMKWANKDQEVDLRLVKIGEQYEFPLPVLSLESMVNTLHKYDFPEKVQVLGKKFVLKCVEVEEEKQEKS